MGDAAQGEPRTHTVFEKPFKVTPEYESWDTPDSYFRYPDSADIPEKLKVWRVQNSGKPDRHPSGVVSFSSGYEDSPDAEVLTAGYNFAKNYDAVGVGRHGNFLQWGYSEPPSKMTEAGKSFFLNCVCYIHKFDGHGPLVKRQIFDRAETIRQALMLERVKNKKSFLSSFTQEQLDKYSKDPRGLARLYKSNIELVYWDKTFIVDEDLRKLGIETNRKVSSLERIIALLNDTGHADTAHLLLARYTGESFDSPAEWKAWFDSNRDRLYFSDVGGYKFRIIPEGYPVSAAIGE
ncbi:hypothetical protein ACFL47_06220 [Candidatus Latescibacterota bacterium]